MRKVAGCCKQAKKDGNDYVWIDTYCIDNNSSSELQEAINAVLKWYQTGWVCYVYLIDVHFGDNPQSFKESAFSKSRWFTRGWKLHKLLVLALPLVHFYNSDWGTSARSSTSTNILSGSPAYRHHSSWGKTN